MKLVLKSSPVTLADLINFLLGFLDFLLFDADAFRRDL